MVRSDFVIKIFLASIVLIFPVFLYILTLKIGDVLSSTSSITQVIEPGVLNTGFVDSNYRSIANPLIVMNYGKFSSVCYSSTGTLGTPYQKIYMTNPDSTDGGWSLALGPTSGADLWVGSKNTFDFNDPTDSGCADGDDGDNYGGQLTLDFSTATLASSGTCLNSSFSLGSNSSFVETKNNSITLVTTSLGKAPCNWTLTGIGLNQSIPNQQSVDNYSINLTLTIAAT